MNRPRVFVVNEPLKWDAGLNSWVRAINLSPARDYGDLVFLLPAGQLPEDPAPTVDALNQGLESITSDDYILLIGDPKAIAWAAAIAADILDGDLRLLHWLKDIRRYAEVRYNVFTSRSKLSAEPVSPPELTRGDLRRAARSR